MEDASKHVSTHQAPTTVSAAKASACTPMVGPALVGTAGLGPESHRRIAQIYKNEHWKRMCNNTN